YADKIPQYYILNTSRGEYKTAGSFFIFNATTSPIVVPVLPGNVTLYLMNNNLYPVSEQVTIRYVS
ncbi:MAG: hypothetical protein ACP5LI_07780, partial [Hydrogenobaculum sp.]